MFLISVGVVWAGYTVIWYGVTTMRGPGVGLLDLVTPSRIGDCLEYIANQESWRSQGNVHFNDRPRDVTNPAGKPYDPFAKDNAPVEA